MPQRLIPVGSYSKPGLQGQGRHHEDGSPEQPRAREDTGKGREMRAVDTEEYVHSLWPSEGRASSDAS